MAQTHRVKIYTFLDPRSLFPALKTILTLSLAVFLENLSVVRK